MSYQDTKIVCRDCEAEFAFSASEQQDFAKRGFNAPTRCPECHQRRTSRRNYSRGGDCAIHTATCSVCGKDAQLPFTPIGARPIYCAECFAAQQDSKAEPSRKGFVLREPSVTPVDEPIADAAKIYPMSQCCRVTHDGKYLFYIGGYFNHFGAFWAKTDFIKDLKANETL